jgi:hypothetical protein
MAAKVEFGPYPCGPTGRTATPVTNSATGTTGAATATLAAGGVNTLTYISGFEITFSNPTAAVTLAITVTGVQGGTLNYTQQVLAAGAAVPPPVPMIVEFPEPIPASALNAAIAVVVPALGAGASGISVVAHGFQVDVT